MAHDVSLTYARFSHIPPTALALTTLLHVAVAALLFWISPLRAVERSEEVIEITLDAPEPAPPPVETSPPPTPVPSAPAAPPSAPPVRLGLPPLPAERSTNPRDVAGVEKPAPPTTDMTTTDTVREDGPKEEARPEEPKPQEVKEEPKPEVSEPPPQQQALAQPEPKAPEPPAPQPPVAQPPQQPAVAKPEPPPPPPPPSLEQALPPVEAPPPPVTERDVPRPVPAPRPAPPTPPKQAVRPTPPPVQRPPTPQPPAQSHQQPPRPSPLGRQPSESQAAAQPSAPVFRNPADNYGQKRAQEDYLWGVMRRIAQFPYVPKNAGLVREEGTVLTRVTISREGRLLDVVLEKSSGLPSLDAGVLDTIRRASPFARLPPDIPGDRHTFQLPVSFKYNEQR